MNTLSAYTHARNCTDITDLKCGIQEVKDAISERIRTGEAIPHFFFVRLKKLEDKLSKLEKHKLPKTNVNQIYNIRDKLDNLANSLQSTPSYNNEYMKYQNGETDYSVIGMLYVASAAVEEIIERELKT